MTDSRLDPALARRYGLAADILDGVADGPVTVVNLFRLREVAADGPGAEPRSGLDAILAYSAVSGERLEAVGGRFLVQGLAGVSLWSEDRWDVVVVAAYPSVSAFASLLSDPAYEAAYAHRTAAVEEQHVVVASTM